MTTITPLEKNIFRSLLVIVIMLVVYFNRWIFSFRFEPDYWENYYYESQWNIPNSKRGISDEGVYRYIGYRLVNGENPFNVDYWVPPLGKYWYGLGAKFLGNPYLISFAYYLISIYVFWLIEKMIISSERTKYLTLLLFIINPLLVEQIGQTMLDLPMTLFFMLTILFLLRAVEKQKKFEVILAGLSLGLMAGIKPAYFVPMIAVVGFVWLYKNKVKDWWCFWPMILIGYLLAYSCYFVAHPNPIPFIRLHEKIINFQKNNGGNHDLFNIFRTVFWDKYKGHWVGAEVIRPENWSIILPIGFTGLFYLIFRFKKVIRENKKIILLIILGLGYIGMLLTIDFWPRYLLMLIPILTLVTGYIFQKKIFLLGIINLLVMLSLIMMLFPSSMGILKTFNENQNNGFYRESYRLLDKETRNNVDENKWKEFFKKIGEKDITPIKEGGRWRIKIKN